MIGKFYLVNLGKEEPRFPSTKRFPSQDDARRYIRMYANGNGLIIEAEEIEELKEDVLCSETR